MTVALTIGITYLGRDHYASNVLCGDCGEFRGDPYRGRFAPTLAIKEARRNAQVHEHQRAESRRKDPR